MTKPLPVHPFPARMAPDIALDICKNLPKGSVVLDPMCGSGTTLRVALERGLTPIGSDLDPLAVLISKVNTTPLDPTACEQMAQSVIEHAKQLCADVVSLPWVDEDQETYDFINFWFAEQQVKQLRRLVHSIGRICEPKDESIANFLKVALSRIIVTKEMRASLARDTSHSRPHRVSFTNNYDCYQGFLQSVKQLVKRIPQSTSTYQADVSQNDARALDDIDDATVDAVITSPPYLNAIDYMRGNKMSLVWFGYKISDLRLVRGQNIGAEKRFEGQLNKDYLEQAVASMNFYHELDTKQRDMFNKYVLDIYEMVAEVARVLKKDGKAILVVGNSCLKGVFIKNTDAVISAARANGLSLNTKETHERVIPESHRYLPINTTAHLAKRMRTETVLSFTKITQ
jgi:DNA modification methylase